PPHRPRSNRIDGKKEARGLLLMREPSSAAPDTKSQELLRLLTCGSVDDGKSTLIGRLLYDSQYVRDDELASLQAETQSSGYEGLDFSILLDGLEAEREQGITIDVAYRYFTRGRRTFILADCPGHEQYTRNMVTAASVSELAILLVDAVKGITQQTRRHTSLVHLISIKHVVLAVNNMALVQFGQDRFDALVRVFQDFGRRLGIAQIPCLPISASHGDNVVKVSPRMPWYRGPSLMQLLETIDVTPSP